MKASFDHVTLADLFIEHLPCPNSSALSTAGVFRGLGSSRKDLRLCVEVGGEGSGGRSAAQDSYVLFYFIGWTLV